MRVVPWHRVLLVIAYVILVAVNVWAGVAGTNTTISRKYETPLTPAGWAFSIWGIIFFLQGAWVVWAVLERGYAPDSPKSRIVSALALPITIVWLLECAWQFAFSTEDFITSSVFIVASWVFAVCGLIRLSEAKEEIYKAGQTIHILDMLAFWSTSINAGWLSAATCIQLMITPISYGATWDDLETFTYIIPVALTGVAIFLAVRKANVLYPATIIWAVSAIKANHPDSQGIQVAAQISIGACAFFIVVAVVLSLAEWKMRRQQPDMEVLSGPGASLTEPLV